MSDIKILATENGWNILFNNKKMAFIEKGSFYLKDIRFKANGEELILFNQLLWTLRDNDPYPYIWSENCEVQINENVWSATAFNKEKTLKTETKLEVISEAEQIKYVVSNKLTVLSDFEESWGYDEIDGKRYFRLEFTDPYFKNIVGPSYEFSGYWPGIFYPGLECNAEDWNKRWSMFVTENPKGTFVGRRHNHMYRTAHWEIANDGILAALDEKSGNPAYRFLMDKCHVDMCLWGYDTHFDILIESTPDSDILKFNTGCEFTAKYEIFCLSDEETKKIKSCIEMEELLLKDRAPIVERGLNRFDKPLELSDTNSWSWFGEGASVVWDTKCGYDDNYSIRLDSNSDKGNQFSFCVGQEMFMEPIKSGKKYRLSMQLKTKDVLGEGVYISVRYGVPMWPGKHGRLQPAESYKSDKLIGNNNWTKVELVTEPAPDGVVSALLSTTLEGRGTVWIDNLLFEPLE